MGPPGLWLRCLPRAFPPALGSRAPEGAGSGLCAGVGGPCALSFSLLPPNVTPRDLPASDGASCSLLVQCVSSGQHTPSETFKIADSHPEVEDRVEPLAPSRSPLFHNKHRYQKIGVHKVSVREGQQYTVLYLATGTASLWDPLAAFPLGQGAKGA